MPRAWLKKIIISPSQTFIAFCVLFLGGIAAGSLFSDFVTLAPGIYWYAGLFVVLAGAILFWKNIFARFFLLACLFFMFGLWRVSVTGFDCANFNNICYYNGQKINITGEVAKYPEEKISSLEYVVKVKTVGIVGEGIELVRQSVNGKILLKTSLANKFTYGDTLAFGCFVEVPKPRSRQAAGQAAEYKASNNFRYDRYLASRNIQAVCNDVRSVTFLSGISQNYEGPVKFIGSKIYWVRSVFFSTASQIWAEPENSFINGLLFGGSSGFPESLKKSFQRTGLSHVLAVSGFNITIIASALMSILILIGLWRRQAFWATLFVLFCFVIMTGATASVVRAAVMGALVLLAQYLGRLSSMGPGLSFTAALMVLISPYILLYDAGFQLSFLATIGLVYLSPVFADVIARTITRVAGRRTKQSFGNNTEIASSLASLVPRNDVLLQGSNILVQTISAIVMTLPLMLYQFGLISLVAPVVNVLLLWSVPFLMLGGFVSLIGGIIYLPLGIIFGAPVVLVSRAFLFVVEWFANLKYAAVEIKIEWWVMLILYGLLVYIIAAKRQDTV
ncbi:MAG: ComEC/Rec2 family competence protein [Candidatus Magasanikbacteria bacterium]|nr:ComEC/Rec2 family competence protein [Candidatus Magasanikbacteria bacterium]